MDCSRSNITEYMCLRITHRCLRHRKVLGGGMRQAGVLAAAGVYALDNIAPKLQQDHANAQMMAKGEDQEHVFFITIRMTFVILPCFF